MDSNIPKVTIFVPLQKYWESLEQMIAIHYRTGEPQKAEPYQHELQRVFQYNQTTGSEYYPVYVEDT
jgi:hypothetical protein